MEGTATSSAGWNVDLAQVTLDAMNALGSLFFVKDDHRRFVLCTDALVRHLGYRHAGQIIGLRDEDLSPEHLVEHYREYDEGILRFGRRVVELVELVGNGDGGYDWFTTTKWPLHDAAGKIVGLAGVTKSLRPRHALEDAILPLTPAIEMIAGEYHRKITVEELAESAAMSPSYFNRQFKLHFGTTPHRYLRSVRLLAVCELLSSTDLSLMAIAHQTGYYDQSHMSNEFTRERGMSPSTYRQRHRRIAPPAAAGERKPLTLRIDRRPEPG
jgi:PAS domain S-box-containing protein